MTIDQLIEKVQQMDKRELALMRRLTRLETELKASKQPQTKRSAYKPKLKGLAIDRAAMHRRIDEKFSKPKKAA